jgi:hypothetical protein
MRTNPFSYFFRIIQSYTGGPMTVITVKNLTQTDNLIAAMKKAGMKHGHVVVANIKGITIQKEGGHLVAVFPETVTVEIVQTSSNGGSSEIDPTATAFVKGVCVSSTGTYNFLNMHLSAQEDHIYFQKLVDSRIDLVG